MRETRRYKAGAKEVLVVVNDMAELQSGKLTLSDTANGRIHFRTEMYGIPHDYRFIVTEAAGCCEVALEMDDRNESDLIYRAFYLLESMMQERPKSAREEKTAWP